jgi:protein phosphatase-4 regulatory subunit 3
VPLIDSSEMGRRVKVYRLNEQGTWDDLGTGNASLFLDKDECLNVVVTSEVDSTKQLLFHQVEHGVVYNRQGDDTIITWNDLYVKTDVALSFQEPAGCAEIWGEIQRVLSDERFQHPSSSQLPRDHVDDPSNREQGIAFEGALGGSSIPSDLTLTELPIVSLENLPKIAEIVTGCTLFQRESLAMQLQQPGYLESILDAFKIAEDLEDIDSISAVHSLIKGAVMLNDVTLLELLFSEEHVVAVVASLEYDSGLSIEACKGRYRYHVQGNMNLKEVVPITDAISREKIMQAHRILYVRDTILPKSLDDSTYSTLSSMYLFNIVEVLLVLHQDQTFFKKLFDKIHGAERGTEDWRDLISFLQELITLSRHIQVSPEK